MVVLAMRIQRFMIAVVTLIFITLSLVISLSREYGGEMQRGEKPQAKKYKESLTPLEMKYQTFLPLIMKMKEEHAGSSENCTNLAKKYSSHAFLVDDSARIRLVVVLSEPAKLSDTLNIVHAVERCGGVIMHPVLPPVGHFQIEISSWIPYDKIDLIMSMPNVAGGVLPPIMFTD